MSTELREALRRLESRPTEQVVAEAQALAVQAANDFRTKEEVETVAAILARISLGEGSFAGIACGRPQACAETSLIYGWMQAERGGRFYLLPETRAELADRLAAWRETSSHCSCVVGSKVRVSRHEAAEAAKANEAKELYLADIRENGHQYGAVMDA